MGLAMEAITLKCTPCVENKRFVYFQVPEGRGDIKLNSVVPMYFLSLYCGYYPKIYNVIDDS